MAGAATQMLDMLERIVEAEFCMGEWPSEAEVRQVIAAATGGASGQADATVKSCAACLVGPEASQGCPACWSCGPDFKHFTPKEA